MNPVYRLYTDASGRRNRLAWAFVLKNEELTIEGAGRGAFGVNQSELIAVLEGLDRISEPSEILVYTDSVYVIRAFRGRCRDALKQRLDPLRAKHKVKTVKVGKGRGSCPDHQRAHHLARERLANEEIK
jgi:ribonuclease HI